MARLLRPREIMTGEILDEWNGFNEKEDEDLLQIRSENNIFENGGIGIVLLTPRQR